MRFLRWLLCCLIGHDYSPKTIRSTEISLVYISTCDRCGDGLQDLEEAKSMAGQILGE